MVGARLLQPRRLAAATDLTPGIDADELRAVATEDYAHLKHHELKAKVEEILAFVTKMNVGDVVLTTSDQNVYLGDVTGEWTYETSDGGRSNLRHERRLAQRGRPDRLRRPPAPLPARFRPAARSSISPPISRSSTR